MTLVAVLALTSCSSDSLVGESPVNNEAPIAFTVSQRNTTRAASNKLEDNGYNDFGVWAYKTKNDESALVMGNYKVGHKNENNETVWYYDGLVTNQVLRYWDYSTAKTDFYAYAPYDAATQFDETNKTITVSSTAGYAATNDVIYAGTSVANANYNEKVQLNFKHIGAKVNIAFRENVAGYKVQLINVKDDTDAGKGIQLTPAIRNGESTNYSYTKENAKYNTVSSVKIDYTTPTAPTTSATATTTSSDNLKFAVPTTGLTEYTAKDAKSTKYNVLPEGTDASYVVSPTTYYAVVQPYGTTTGFTLHVSYKLIAEDNGEEITVRDARVFIPADQVKWESNKAYTYNFTINSSATGNTAGTVDVDDADPTVGGLLPIVFDQPTIVDYENAAAVDGNI